MLCCSPLSVDLDWSDARVVYWPGAVSLEGSQVTICIKCISVCVFIFLSLYLCFCICIHFTFVFSVFRNFTVGRVTVIIHILNVCLPLCVYICVFVFVLCICIHLCFLCLEIVQLAGSQLP